MMGAPVEQWRGATPPYAARRRMARVVMMISVRAPLPSRAAVAHGA